VEEIIVLREGGRGVAEGSVVRAVPVGREFGRALLEDLAAAFGAEEVVPETEVFVEHESATWDPLIAILASYVAFVGWRIRR
jgi:hypothetical protein